MNALSDSSKTLLRGFLSERAGQQLVDTRILGIENALLPIVSGVGMSSLDELVTKITMEPRGRLADTCLNAMMNHETSFFRDRHLFDQVTGSLMDELRERNSRTRRLRIWSAACSHGQEIYSLAISFAEQARLWDGWKIEMLATDISDNAVERARVGRYSQMEVQRGLRMTQIVRFFEREGENWQARDTLKANIRFRQHNILRDPTAMGRFDLVLLRNLLIYQDIHSRCKAISNARKATVDGGYLMLGATETVIGLTEDFEPSRRFRGLYKARTEMTDNLLGLAI